jgi:hypothetical protein
MSILRYKQKLFADGGVFRTGGGSGGGGAPSQTTVQNSNIPEYARPYVETMLGSAQQQIYNYDDTGTATGFKPYVPYGATVDAAGNITNTAQEQAGAAVAPFSPLQQQAFRNAGTVGMPGQFNLGTGYQAMGGAGALNAGQNYNMMATNPYAQQAFMSPYMQNVVDVQKQEALRDAQKSNIGMNLASARQGTYGGARQVLAEQERNRNLQTQLGNIQATGTQKAFETAQQAQQYGANLGLQGYGQAVGAGTALGQMGGQQLAAQQGIVGLQSQMGQQQQAQQQNYINQAIQNYAMQQQYPMQQLSAMSGLLRGLPLQSATTQSYQAAPSAISQISGLGLTGAAAYGMMKKEGGVIKSYANGGTVEDDTENFVSGGIAQSITNKVRMNPDGYSKQAIDKSTKSGLVDDLVGLAAIQEKNKNEKERQAAAAMAQGTPPTVKDQILAERAALDQQRRQGIEMAQSNLPTEYAGGGIVAFDDGGEVEHFDVGGISLFGRGDATSDTREPSAFREDIRALNEKTKGKMQLPDWMQEVKGYFTAPRQSPTDADAQPGGLYGSGSNVAPEVKKDDLTVVRGTPAKPAAPAASAPTTPAAPTETDAGGIDALIKQLTGDIKESNKSNADARKEAKLMAMLQAGLGIMGGTSQYAAANFKGAIPALQGYQEEMRGIRGDEAKQIAQLAALNLKGAELKQELKKLGINEQHYRDQAKLMAAQANYYNQRGAATGAGNFGSISSPTALQMMQDYKGALANPTSSPVFKTLDKRTQTFLTKADPSTASYQEAYKVFKNKLDSDFKGDVQFVRAVGNKRSDLSSLE